VLTPHESLTAYDVEREKQLVKRCLKRLYLRRASLILLASSLEADDSVGVQHRGKSKVLPHPLEHMPRNGRARHGGEVPSPEAPLSVGFLGRLHPKKNVDLLIEAIGAVERDVHLRVAGTGPEAYEARLVRHAHAAGVADRVAWVGFVQRDDRQRFFGDVDLLALVSEYECFGVAAAEAMSGGVAVLVSERTGIAPIVAKHACGFVVAPDVASIVEALRVATEDRKLLALMAARGPSAVEQELSMEAYGTSVRRSYQALAHRGNPPLAGFK
jgi:glycosyltransferase involved in cell wall biosynthesis